MPQPDYENDLVFPPQPEMVTVEKEVYNSIVRNNAKYIAEVETLKSKLAKRRIGNFDDEKQMVYCGDLRGREVWCGLKDAPEQMEWEDAKIWCEKQGGMLPTIDMLTVAYLNKEAVNKSLVKHGGQPFDDDEYYWSSSENLSGFSWYIDMGNGYRYYSSKNLSFSVRVFQLI